MGNKINALSAVRQNKKELHEKMDVERKSTSDSLKIEYTKLRKNPAMLDLRAKLKAFSEWHLKVAKDGVGYRKTGTDANGKDIMEIVYHTNNKRVSELDRAAGLQEGIDYLDRQLVEVIKEVLPNSDPNKVV